MATGLKRELLHAGAGRALITPPAGFAVSGPEHGRTETTGIDDDLLARVIVLEAEGRRAAICSLDTWGLNAELRSAITQSVARGAGTLEAFTWVTVSGNGVSPPTWTLSEPADSYSRYLSYLPELCGGAAVQARETMEPAALGVSVAQLTDVMTGAGGKGAEADTAVNVASIAAESGHGLAQLVSFSCPGIIRGDDGRWTADYPGYSAWALEQAGGGTVAFARGADSDVRPYDWYEGNTMPTHMQRNASDVQALGLLLATQVAMATRQVDYRRNMSIESSISDDGGIHVLRVGPLVLIAVDVPQPSIFARHLRRGIPRSTVIVSANVAGHPLDSSIELDVDLELTALETARAAGAK